MSAESLELARRALLTARRALEFNSGCWMTDRPDLLASSHPSVPREQLLWRKDEREAIRMVDEALAALDGVRLRSSRTGP